MSTVSCSSTGGPGSDESGTDELGADDSPALMCAKHTNHLLAQLLSEMRKTRALYEKVFGAGGEAAGLSRAEAASFCTALSREFKRQSHINNTLDNFTKTDKRVGAYLQKGLNGLPDRGTGLDEMQIKSLKTIIVKRLRSRRTEIARKNKQWGGSPDTSRSLGLRRALLRCSGTPSELTT